MSRHLTEAVVFVLSSHLLPDAGRCIDYCRVRGYRMIGVIKDDWRAAIEYIYDGRASVLVVADVDHLDPNRMPRIEVVADRLRNDPPTDGRERNCRTSRINRRDVNGKRTNRRDGEA